MNKKLLLFSFVLLSLQRNCDAGKDVHGLTQKQRGFTKFIDEDKLQSYLSSFGANPTPAQAENHEVFKRSSSARKVKKTKKVLTTTTTETSAFEVPKIPTKPLKQRNNEKNFSISPRQIVHFELDDAKYSEEYEKLRQSRKLRVKRSSDLGAKTNETKRTEKFITKDTFVQPREFFKFSLMDAVTKAPSTNAGEMKESEKKSKREISNDSTATDTKKIHVTNPMRGHSSTKHVSYDNIPAKLQKMIDSALNDAVQKGKASEGDYLKFYYGDKIIKVPVSMAAYISSKKEKEKEKEKTFVKEVQSQPKEVQTSEKANQSYEKALQNYEKAIQSYPKEIQSSEKANQSYEKALQNYEKAIQNYPKEVQSYENANQSYEKELQDYEKAIQSYPKAVQSYPKETLVYSKKIVALPEPPKLEVPKLLGTKNAYFSLATSPIKYGSQPKFLPTPSAPTENAESFINFNSAPIVVQPDSQEKDYKKSVYFYSNEKNAYYPKNSMSSPGPVVFEDSMTTPISIIESPKAYNFKSYVYHPEHNVKAEIPIVENVDETFDYIPEKTYAQVSSLPEKTYTQVLSLPEKTYAPYPPPTSYIEYAGNHKESHDQSKNYEFGYHISDYKTGNNYGHSQKSTKDETKGEYSILLPDGRVQLVKYYADDSGFHADVSYQNVH